MNKNRILGLLGLLIIFQGCSKDDINEEKNAQVRTGLTYVPDDVFEQYLIDQGHDDVLDDYVVTADVVDIVALEILGLDKPDESKLRSLEGIQDFIALQELAVSNNLISTIDLTKNVNLAYAGLGGNRITAIDVSNNLHLDMLEVSENPLKTLDISQNKKLEVLKLLHTSIEGALDLTDLPVLTWVEAIGNPYLTAINVTGSAVRDLNIWGNNLKTITMGDNPELEILMVERNALTSIDVSGAPGLVRIFIHENKLTSLDVSPLVYGIELKTTNNPDLRCIKVADGQYEESIFHTDEDVNISKDCDAAN